MRPPGQDEVQAGAVLSLQAGLLFSFRLHSTVELATIDHGANLSSMMWFAKKDRQTTMALASLSQKPLNGRRQRPAMVGYLTRLSIFDSGQPG